MAQFVVIVRGMLDLAAAYLLKFAVDLENSITGLDYSNTIGQLQVRQPEIIVGIDSNSATNYSCSLAMRMLVGFVNSSAVFSLEVDYGESDSADSKSIADCFATAKIIIQPHPYYNFVLQLIRCSLR